MIAAGGLTELGEHSGGEGVTRGVRNWRWPLSAAICSQLMIQAMVSGHPRSGAAFKNLGICCCSKDQQHPTTTDDPKRENKLYTTRRKGFLKCKFLFGYK